MCNSRHIAYYGLGNDTTWLVSGFMDTSNKINPPPLFPDPFFSILITIWKIFYFTLNIKIIYTFPVRENFIYSIFIIVFSIFFNTKRKQNETFLSLSGDLPFLLPSHYHGIDLFLGWLLQNKARVIV